MTAIAISIGRRSWGGLKLVLLSFYAQWLMFVIPALYLLTNYLLFERLPHRIVAGMFDLFVDLMGFSIPAGIVVMLVVRLVQYATILKPESPLKALYADVMRLFQHPSNFINGLPILFAMTFFNKAMIELKIEIPKINPFSWDPFFSSLDRTMHFGIDPWVLLQPLMGYDFVTFTCNILYDFWFLALFGSWVWFGFQNQASELRTRFFFSYMLIWWVGGGLLAVLFSSAGPVYYSAIGLHNDPYIGLMSYLHDVNTRLPIWSLGTQDLLWNGYLGKTDPFGISAFPSMHNGSAILFALTFRHVSKLLGWFFGIYAVIILVTSVHLGWHYAVDGYAAIAIGFVCWWVSGPIAKFAHSRPSMVKYNQELAAI